MILIALILGIVFMGSATSRQIEAQKGDVPRAGMFNIGVMVANYFMISYVSKDNINGFISFTIGTTIGCMGVAWRRKRELHSKSKTSKNSI